MSDTKTNLEVAFAGESMANRKYTAFARKAEQEGFPVVARLFRAAAEAETIHAIAHLANMDGIKSTAENLKTAIEGETYEYQSMYPPMIEQAKAENHKARRMFEMASQAEAVHAKLYAMALEAVQNGKDLDADVFYMCPVCGDIEIGQPPEKCPICGAKGDRYQKM